MFKEFYEKTGITNVREMSREKWGRRCDFFIFFGFSIVLGTQLYWNFGPKPVDQKAFVGPPKPIYLVRR